MDWYAWLCRAGLHPDAALEYALLFARNELGAADVRHLDHEFLATMGVAVAKHRLEILKLARKESSSSHGKAVAAAITALPWRATRLLAAAVHRSARSALARLRASVSSSSSSPSRGLGRRGRSGGGGDRDAHAHALLAAPRLTLPARRRGGGGRAAAHGWSKIAASPSPARAGKLPLATMMLTNVSKPVLLTSSRADRWWSSGATAVKALPAPAAAVAGCLPSTEARSCGEDEDEEMDAGEEMRWEAMFQDLKPT